MKKYLKDLEKELKKNNLSDEEIEEIISDHEEMIEAAINEGLTDEELEAKFGTPKAVAEELADFSEKAEENPGEEPVREGKKLEFANVDDNYDVNISLINEDIKVILHDKESIIVEFVGKIKERRYEISFTDNVFYLGRKRGIEGRSYFEVNSKKKFNIYLPKSKPVMNFKFKVINGDAVIKGLSSSEFTIGTNNGDVKLEEINTKILSINTINGDLSLDQVNCDDFKLSLISGDIKATKVKINNDLSCNSVSGDISLNDVECDTLSLKTVSGDVSGKEFYPKAVKLATVSGDIEIVNSKETQIQIKQKRSVSGKIRIVIK